MNNEPTPLDVAAYALLMAKEAEKTAASHRLACEAAVIHLAGLKEEGAKTSKTAFYKVTTTQTLIRSLVENYGEKLDTLPADVFCQLVKHKPTLSVSVLKVLEADEPDLYRIALSAIVTKPGKPSVSVTPINQQKETA